MKPDLCEAYGICHTIYKQLENDNNRNNIVDNDVYLYNNNNVRVCSVPFFWSYTFSHFAFITFHFVSFRVVSFYILRLMNFKCSTIVNAKLLFNSADADVSKMKVKRALYMKCICVCV